MIRAMNHFQNGILPIDGGWSEQSAKLTRLLDIAISERNKLLEAERRAAEAKTTVTHGTSRRR